MGWNPFQKKEGVGAHSMVSLTARGKTYASSAGGKDYSILTSLEEQSPQTITKIAEDTNLDATEVRSRIKILSQQGMVTVGGKTE